MTIDRTHAQQVADAEPYTLDSRCRCTHRYPHHAGLDGCAHCDCHGFVLTTGLVARQRTGPACQGCGAELLLVRPERRRCARCTTHPETTP